MSERLKHRYYWVIRSKQKRKGGLWQKKMYFYFAERTSLKNPRYQTELHWHVKWFTSKFDAQEYLVAKARHVGATNCRVVRKKMFLDKKGKYDYWKNRESLNK